MNLKNAIFILLQGIYLINKASATEPTSTLSEGSEFVSNSITFEHQLFTDLKVIETKVMQGYQKSSSKTLCKAYKNFMKLSYNEQEWEQAAKMKKVPYWPSQRTYKERIGAHLFYPICFEWLLESPHTEPGLQQPALVQGFEIAARFHHSLGLYYLAYTLDLIYSRATHEKPLSIKIAYDKAIKELQQCTDNSEACYILGRNYTEDSYNIKALEINPQLGYELHMKGRDERNQFAALIIREKMRGMETPSFDDYKRLAEYERYGPAYIKLSILTDNFERKLYYLNLAISETFFNAALVDKGLLYLHNKDSENAAKCFLEAGKEGIAEGYINLGILKVGDLLTLPRQAISESIARASVEKIQKAAKFFELAGKLHYAKGWEYLAALYTELFKKTSDMSYGNKLRASLVKGIKNNSLKTYDLMKALFPEDFLSIKTPVFQKCSSVLPSLLNQ